MATSLLYRHPPAALGALTAALLLLAPATHAQPRVDAADEARAYVRHHAFLFGDGLTSDDLADLVVTDAYASRRSGTAHVYLRQAHQGIPVVGTEITVAVGRDGRAFYAAGSGTALAGRALAASPAVPAEAAASAVARDAGLAAGAFAVVSSTGGPAPEVVLSDGGVAEEAVTARLVYFREAPDAVSLAWEVGLYERGAQHYWHAFVDALGGRVLARYDLVVHDHFGPAEGTTEASAEATANLAPLVSEGAGAALAPLALVGRYKVYPLPVESPNHTTPLPPADGRVLVANPNDLSASPYGWHDTNGFPGSEFTYTRGNNVHAYIDWDDDNVPDADLPDGGPGLLFDFPVFLQGQPGTYFPAAVTNLFYWNNAFHDVMWHYGFDEPAGNFQVNNYGHGGLGNDDVRAEAQDGGGLNNANFFTPVDGQRPRMQMYLWNFTSPMRDGDFDNGIILHEYGHGVSNRLVGGPGTTSCLSNSEQMGEGWSDLFGILLTMKPGDTRTTRRGVGTYALGQPITGTGIRQYPYSTNFAVNPMTYGHTRTAAIPHGVGSVWATIVWEATWDLIDTHGFDPDLYDASGTAGNQVMLRLLTHAMKLTPCSPGFEDARQAILTADLELYNGAHVGTLWSAFARRGLGIDADQGSTSTNADNVEDFTLPVVKLTLTPEDPPVVVARGETFTYRARLAVSDDSPPVTLEYWVEATLPSGDVVVALGPRSVSLTPGTTVTRRLSQRVPGGAPPGDYLYVMKIGAYPAGVIASGGFGFTVTAFEGAAREAGEAWLTYDERGERIPDDAEIAFFPLDEETATTEAPAPAASAGLPGEPELHAPYPNPLSGIATIQYEVAETGDVRLVVYDLLGREAAVLADGAHTAGRHTATLDARGLPNGTYLVRMAAGPFVRTRRVTVVR